MKALRYLLIAVAILSIVSVHAQDAIQNWGKLPETEMHSTSAMVGSGSTLPSAAITGVSTTYSPANASSRPRRIGENDGFEEEEDPDKPGEPFPLGDVVWPLMLCAGAFLIIRIARRKRAKIE